MTVKKYLGYRRDKMEEYLMTAQNKKEKWGEM